MKTQSLIERETPEWIQADKEIHALLAPGTTDYNWYVYRTPADFRPGVPGQHGFDSQLVELLINERATRIKEKIQH